MTVLLAGIGLLFLSFCAQLVFWRIFVPGRQIRALLVIFFLVPLVVFGVVQLTGTPIALAALSAAETARLAIFYGSCALTYIVLFSAIEEQSPTLAIISYVAEKSQCTGADFVAKFGKGHELSHRIELLARSELVKHEGDRYRLAPPGDRLAKLFDAANRLFGIESGG
jgi:hypothetical protein